MSWAGRGLGSEYMVNINMLTYLPGLELIHFWESSVSTKSKLKLRGDQLCFCIWQSGYCPTQHVLTI